MVPDSKSPVNGQLRITYIGHATLLLEFGNVRILTDPNFDEKLGRFLPRVTPPGVKIAELPRIDAVLITHAHADHLSFRSLRMLPSGIPIYAPPVVTRWLHHEGFSNARAIASGQTIHVGTLAIEAATARHVGARYGFDRWRGLAYMYLLDDGASSVLFTGDTAITPSAAILTHRILPRRVDVALLPIGDAPWWKRSLFRRGHLTADDALTLFEQTEARIFIPFHWGTFRHVTSGAFDAIRVLRTRLVAYDRVSDVKILAHGESLQLETTLSVSSREPMNARVLPGASDTIAAQATPGSRSALAVIRVSGREAHKIGEVLLEPWHATARRVFLSTLHDPETKKAIDQCVVTVYAAPASYTGEDMVELSLHGGEVGPALAFNALLAAGARPALPGELTRRALLNGKLDLLQAEAIADLIDSRSRAMHDVALDQLAGHLSTKLRRLRSEIVELEALLAYDMDFPEEDDGPISASRIDAAAQHILDTIDSLLATAATGEMIRSGAAIVIAGAPNAGKSSLFNALAGTQRAIVTELPGTTRDALEAVMDIGPWPVRLVDTAGLRASDDVVERLGIEVAERQVHDAAIVLVCGEDAESLALALERVRPLTSATLLAVGTKSDRGTLPHVVESAVGYVAVSARTGEGLSDLVARIVGILDDARQPASSANPVLTRERHRVALTRARDEIAAFVKIRIDASGLPATVAAVHLHSARGYLEELVGALDIEEVLDRVFSTFCVGK